MTKELQNCVDDIIRCGEALLKWLPEDMYREMVSRNLCDAIRMYELQKIRDERNGDNHEDQNHP